MPCFKPLQGYHKPSGGWTSSHAASNGIPLTLPCGQCIGCRADKRDEWAVRLVHESRLHQDSMFLTLTYDNNHVPIGYGLDKRHVQLFMKRYRQAISPRKIRFFAVGEYGETRLRPHYHLLIFGHWPKDSKRWNTQEKHCLFTSQLVCDLWGKGLAVHGDLTPETCKYVAHYTTKKMTGLMAKDHYTRLDEFGELHQVIPEFSLQSRRPGIGADFYLKNKNDFRSGDFSLLSGKKQRVPKYYDKLLERENEQLLVSIKDTRKLNARKHRANNTPARLAVREACMRAKVALNTRKEIPHDP
ncbi:MAG: replication initiator protein [Microviridae sp.]|nr:MAG: replication initiator protein [Microviridae sp.]